MRRRGRMVVELTTTCAIVAYHHLSCEFEPIHGEVYSIKHYVIKFVSDLRQIWISLGTPISATKVVAEIFLKVVLNT